MDFQRLEEVRKNLKMSKKEFAENAGISVNTYQKYVRGGVDFMSSETLMKLAKGTGMSTDYLLGLNDFVTPYDKISPEEIVEVPVYGSVPAGKPIEALQVDGGYVDMRRSEMSNNPYIGLKVKGDSMYPFYLEDDIVIVEITNSYNSGEDVIVFLGYDNEATLKRIHNKDDHIELEPLNREYKVKKIYPEDNIPVRVLGRVVELKRKII